MTDVTQNQGQAEAELSAADEQVLARADRRARAGGSKLTGEGGLLGRRTKMVIEGALEGRLDDHLGYGKHRPGRPDGGNPVMAGGPRRCSPIRGRWRFRCPGTGIAVSSRKSSPKGSGG